MYSNSCFLAFGFASCCFFLEVWGVRKDVRRGRSALAGTEDALALVRGGVLVFASLSSLVDALVETWEEEVGFPSKDSRLGRPIFGGLGAVSCVTRPSLRGPGDKERA